MPLLIFVDTNVLLDFYRLRSREAGLSILKKLEQHKSSLISTDQVAMEFMKNRQRVLLDTHKTLKAPDWASLALPPVLTETKSSKAIEKHKKALSAHSLKLRERLTKVLKKPSSYDPVYQTMRRIGNTSSPYFLGRDKKARHEIRELAEKRYWLGYPPRKDADTSFGDAINWEWIVRCARESGNGVVIVTRDSDYGASVDNGHVLNDWLREEWRDRVSKKRRVLLTDRITNGLKELAVPVSRQEEEATQELVRVPASPSNPPLAGPSLWRFLTWATESEPPPGLVPTSRGLLDIGSEDDASEK